MKTIDEIKAQIEKETKDAPCPVSKEKKKIRKQAQSKVKWLRSCLMYLESIPTEEFLRDQLSKKESELDKIMTGFDSWEINTPGMLGHPKAKGEYNKLMGTSRVRKHIEILDFLVR